MFGQREAVTAQQRRKRRAGKAMSEGGGVGGVNLTLIVGNVEMKEVLESPSRVELIFFPSSFFHEYQIET